MMIVNEKGTPQGKWYRCHKKSYGVYICRPKAGILINNILECSTFEVKKGELVVSGSLGEQWTIKEEKALRTYQMPDSTPLDELVKREHFDWTYVITRVSNVNYYAFFLPKEEYSDVGLYDLPTTDEREAKYHDSMGRGYRIISHINSKDSASDHGNGDFLLCSEVDGKPDFSNIWVVDGRIFSLTYSVEENIDEYLVRNSALYEIKRPRSLL